MHMQWLKYYKTRYYKIFWRSKMDLQAYENDAKGQCHELYIEKWSQYNKSSLFSLPNYHHLDCPWKATHIWTKTENK